MQLKFFFMPVAQNNKNSMTAFLLFWICLSVTDTSRQIFDGD